MDYPQHPISALVRDDHGVPVLKLYHLGTTQLQAIHDIMILNGDDAIHHARSSTLAHLGEFDSFTGIASITIHDETTASYHQFLGMLEERLGMTFPTIPVQDYMKTA